MKPSRLLAVAAVLSALASHAVAADWDAEFSVVPGASPIYGLSGSGRGAAVDRDGTIHLVMHGTEGGGAFRVYYTQRTAAGAWSATVSLSESDGNNPSLAVGRDGTTHVVWETASGGTTGISYRARTPEGGWLPVESVATSVGGTKDPVCAADAFGRVHASWLDASSGKVRIAYARRGTDGVWDAPQFLGSPAGIPESPSMATDGYGVIHLAWSERLEIQDNPRDLNREIFYANVPASGAPPSVVRLTSAGGNSRSPFLEATADGTLHLVWLDNRSSPGRDYFEIFYRRYLPGIGWGKDKRFSYDGIDHARPVVAAGAQNTVNVAWEDFRHGNPEIYFRQITVETGWDREATRLTRDLNASLRPALLAFPGGNLLLLWTDSPDATSFQVYAREGSIRYEEP